MMINERGTGYVLLGDAQHEVSYRISVIPLGEMNKIQGIIEQCEPALYGALGLAVGVRLKRVNGKEIPIIVGTYKIDAPIPFHVNAHDVNG